MKNAHLAIMKTINTRTSWLFSLLFVASLLFSFDGYAQKGSQDDEDKPKKPLITQEEYNKLGGNYPTGKYVKIGDYDTFNILFCSQYLLEQESTIQIIFWRKK